MSYDIRLYLGSHSGVSFLERVNELTQVMRSPNKVTICKRCAMRTENCRCSHFTGKVKA